MFFFKRKKKKKPLWSSTYAEKSWGQQLTKSVFYGKVFWKKQEY